MTTAIAAVIGLLAGHALDLVFDRLYTGAPLGGPLYRCRHCRTPLRPPDLLPLVGVFASRGRCRDCGRGLPLHAFVLAPGAAALFAAADLAIGPFGAALLAGFFATIFLVLTLTDLEHRLIPNRVVYSCTLLAAALCWAWPDTSVVEILAGGLAATVIAGTFLLFSLPFGEGAFGMGDVKMIVLMGFVTGLPAVIIGIFVGTILGGIAAALLVLTRLRKMSDYVPHGPFLAAGGIIALLWGQDIWDWYR